MTRRLVLLRHGETLDNAAGIFQGQRDTQLSAVGLEQAAAVASLVASYEPALCVSSDLSRALVTARTVAEPLDLDVAIDARLREIDVGWWSGLTHAQAWERDPGTIDALDRGEDVPRGDTGETVATTGERTALALRDVVARLGPGETGLVVGHGMALRAAAGVLMGMSAAGAVRSLAGLGNCHLAVLRHGHARHWPTDAERWLLHAWNLHA